MPGNKLHKKLFIFIAVPFGYGGLAFFSVLAYLYFLVTGFQECRVRSFIYWISRYVMFFVKIFAESYAVETMPVPQGGAIITPNHSSILDILCMSQFGMRDMVFLARGWPFRVLVMGRLLRAAGGQALEEAENFSALAVKARAVFEKGLKLVIFPEGTRSPDGAVHRFRSGAFALAQECGVPIIPVAIKGLGQALPKGKYWPMVSGITLSLLAPVENADTSALQFAKYVRHLIVEKLAEGALKQ
ncbi:MAG: 1-acyl-sn-glycerol-3-phosphate acyltransferase [Spirochaetota bacterium]|jgi:1-acyl-sn-glycerol-3-phosphate acyltransferase|nr:1-acyl-sn-glycerol-3-phosphate acyltransferase [Spirochaetota bacterium]